MPIFIMAVVALIVFVTMGFLATWAMVAERRAWRQPGAVAESNRQEPAPPTGAIGAAAGK
jgi:hypothetical protein